MLNLCHDYYQALLVEPLSPPALKYNPVDSKTNPTQSNTKSNYNQKNYILKIKIYIDIC